MIDASKRLAITLMLVVMGGCAALTDSSGRGDVPDVMIGGLIVLNQGQAYVTAARVLVPATGQFVSCGNIAPGARCATGFPEQNYSGNPLEVTWSQGGNIYSTGELRPNVPEDAIESGHAQVRIWIMGPGSAAAEMVAIAGPQ